MKYTKRYEQKTASIQHFSSLFVHKRLKNKCGQEKEREKKKREKATTEIEEGKGHQ